MKLTRIDAAIMNRIAKKTRDMYGTEDWHAGAQMKGYTLHTPAHRRQDHSHTRCVFTTRKPEA